MSARSDVLTELRAIRELLEAQRREEDVWTIDDMAAHLKMARRNIEKLRRARAFPFPEITTIKDKRPRWSVVLVRRMIHSDESLLRKLRRAS